MAETPGIQQQAADGSEGLLATKFYVPRTPLRFVARPRLLDRLDDGVERDLTLVSAPAGFGKTSLLADWSRQQQHPVAWLSVDGRDNDPVRFWRHVVVSLDRVRRGLLERVSLLMDPPGPVSFDVLVTEVVNALARDDDDVLLVLDDCHLIDAQDVHASLQFLLEHRPTGLHVVVSSRADPPLPLARLRAQGQLTEVRAAELRFAPDEAAALLRGSVGPDLDDDTVEALTERTEGWAVGLQLAGLSLHGHPDAARLVESFSGSHRYVLDYLAEEVLEQQPESLREFLLETSVLDRLSGPLCDAVTDRTNSQQMLETIEAANLFLMPLDELRGWWRYHHLFADLLRARLWQEHPGRIPELHRKAAGWHHEHGLGDDAVRHALVAGDETWAARLAESYIDEFLMRSEGATVQRWLAALPHELADSRPRLLVAEARVALLAGDVERVEHLLDAAERTAADVADEPFEPSTGRAASPLANLAAMMTVNRAFLAELRGDAEATTAFAEKARAELNEGEWMLELLTRWHLAVAEWLRGGLPDAEHAFAECAAEFSAAGEPMLSSWSSWNCGQIQFAQGRLNKAIETYREALELTTPAGRPPLPAAGLAHVGLAEVAYQRNDLDEALNHATEGISLCRHLTHTQPLATGLATLAWIHHARGDTAGARAAIGEAEEATGTVLADVLNPVPAQRARLSLSQGDVAAAAGWVAERGLGVDDELAYSFEPAYLVLARVLLAQDHVDQALRLLDRLQASGISQDRVGSVIEIHTLRAIALAAAGDQDVADDAFANALALGAPQGYVRVFVDEGTPMADLLGRHIATHPRQDPDVPSDYLGTLVRAFAQNTSGTMPAAVVPSLVVQLTDREREVLDLLAEGMTNRQIADELYVSLHTVKKHVTHILDKLGAANRTEATTRARELGLVT